MTMKRFLNTLCAALLCASMGTVVACGDDGGSDGDDNNNAVNNANNDTNNDENNDPVCGNGVCDDGETAASCAQDCEDDVNNGPECGDGVCDEGEDEATCPADCAAPPQACEAIGDACDENTIDGQNLTCIAGIDSTNPMEATCHQLCDPTLESADCPRSSFCAELNDGRAVCVRSNCTSPLNSEEECANVGENGGTCFEAENDTFFCFAAGAGEESSACTDVEDCGPGLFCVSGVCEAICTNGSDDECDGDAGKQCLPLLNSEGFGVCGDGCPGFDTTDECGEGRGCLPLADGIGICQNAGETAVDEECTDPEECVPFALCQRLNEGDPSSCRQVCDRAEGFGDETCPEGEICLEINDAAGVCFDGCTPFVPEDENGCPTEGLRSCLPIDSPDRGLCLASGDKELGADCDFIDDSILGDCQGGALCVGSDPDADGGTCEAMCRTFSSVNDFESGCEEGEVCAIFGTAFGACTDEDVADPPVAAFAECPIPGQWCDDDILCLNVGAGQNICLPLCRLGSDDDCDSYESPNGGTAACDEALASDTLGLCL